MLDTKNNKVLKIGCSIPEKLELKKHTGEKDYKSRG